jgi:hypothetical protein
MVSQLEKGNTEIDGDGETARRTADGERNREMVRHGEGKTDKKRDREMIR